MTVLFCNHYPPLLLNIAVDFMTTEILIFLGWKNSKICLPVIIKPKV